MRRRHLITPLGLLLAASLLMSACAPAAPAAPTAAPKPTVATVAPASEAKPAQPAAAATSAPAAKPAEAAAAKPAAGSAAWDQIVADAKKEGKLVVAHSSLESNNRVLDAFRQKYPEITVENQGMAASVFGPRAVSEQRQGLHAWDLLFMTGFNTAERVLVPAGAVGDIRPFLADLPADVKDDSKWAGGFMMLRNEASPDSIVTDFSVGYQVFVNRAALPASEFSNVDQLLDPKLKGKIAIYRPGQSSAGSQAMATLLANKGEDFVRKVLFDQAPVAVDNQRQVTEWVVQGRYPIAIGISDDALEPFTSQGLGKEVEAIKGPATATTSASGVTLLKNPPHPNAVKVFLAWYLSKEGQDAYVERGAPGSVSRRLDAVVKYPDARPDFTRLSDYKVVLGTPSGDTFLDKAIAIGKELG